MAGLLVITNLLVLININLNICTHLKENHSKYLINNFFFKFELCITISLDSVKEKNVIKQYKI